ncbi:Glycosyl hydrolase family 46 [Desulfonatronum thiosulfatophilum]|uniref:Glycosyl hydrolase family 46 n=1 Tax=Desulfonatronum thiosulfatophilum TaxID=617002 RepID=A0A1G6CLG1_9BACT|nr:chitosanase [Desulfonatronum thiosulfatophilum]SDB33666.1 Glycosyl hydrolase family 46 [Desulfonatronum thiosulfatophilum]
MIVNYPWSPLFPPGKIQHNFPQHGPLDAETRRNTDFLAEMLKLSLNTSAIKSLGELPGTDASPLESTLTQMNRLPSTINGQAGTPPFPGIPPSGPPLDSPAALLALIQATVEHPAQPPSDPANTSSLRRAISAYAPHYSAEGLRQKIDFSTKHAANHAQPASATLASPSSDLLNRRTGTMSGHPADAPEAMAHLEKNPARVRFREHDPSAFPRHADRMQPLEFPVQPGILAARFESANRPDAIGYDRRGGTCYGTYQLSSRMGGMDNFLKFLDTEAPQWAKRLRNAGPANTKGTSGAMPAEWKRIHQEDPRRFAALQHAFTQKAYYDPAARLVRQRTGIDPSQASPALREVIWSTAVQHGVHGAANVFQRALNTASAGGNTPSESELIQAVYSERKTRFTGSTPAVRSAVQTRFDQEMQLALALLPDERDVLV